MKGNSYILAGIMIVVLIFLIYNLSGRYLNPAAGKIKKLSPAEAKEMLAQNDDIALIDVRSREEYENEHLPDSISLPLDEIEQRVEDIIPDRESTIFLYCRRGNRSNTAAKILLNSDYNNVYNIGGIVNWPYETEKGAGLEGE